MILDFRLSKGLCFQTVWGLLWDPTIMDSPEFSSLSGAAPEFQSQGK